MTHMRSSNALSALKASRRSSTSSAHWPNSITTVRKWDRRSADSRCTRCLSTSSTRFPVRRICSHWTPPLRQSAPEKPARDSPLLRLKSENLPNRGPLQRRKSKISSTTSRSSPSWFRKPSSRRWKSSSATRGWPKRFPMLPKFRTGLRKFPQTPRKSC